MMMAREPDVPLHSDQGQHGGQSAAQAMLDIGQEQAETAPASPTENQCYAPPADATTRSWCNDFIARPTLDAPIKFAMLRAVCRAFGGEADRMTRDETRAFIAKAARRERTRRREARVLQERQQQREIMRQASAAGLQPADKEAAAFVINRRKAGLMTFSPPRSHVKTKGPGPSHMRPTSQLDRTPPVIGAFGGADENEPQSSPFKTDPQIEAELDAAKEEIARLQAILETAQSAPLADSDAATKSVEVPPPPQQPEENHHHHHHHQQQQQQQPSDNADAVASPPMTPAARPPVQQAPTGDGEGAFPAPASVPVHEGVMTRSQRRQRERTTKLAKTSMEETASTADCQHQPSSPDVVKSIMAGWEKVSSANTTPRARKAAAAAADPSTSTWLTVDVERKLVQELTQLRSENEAVRLCNDELRREVQDLRVRLEMAMSCIAKDDDARAEHSDSDATEARRGATDAGGSFLEDEE